jgi:hypothetical protein
LAEPVVDLDAGFMYDTNVGNGSVATDIHGDGALTGTISAGQLIALSGKDSLALMLNATGEAYNRYSGLSNTALGGTVSLRRKFGIGPDVPSVRGFASAARLDFANNVRNGWRYRSGIDAGKRLGERVDLLGGFEYEKRTADHSNPSDPDKSGDAFSLINRSFFLDARYSPGDKTQFSLRYVRRKGDVVITTTAPDDSFDDVSPAETRDTVFGPDAIAYKLHAINHILRLGVSQAINARSSLNFGLQREFSYGDGGHNYFKSVANASIIVSF